MGACDMGVCGTWEVCVVKLCGCISSSSDALKKDVVGGNGVDLVSGTVSSCSTLCTEPLVGARVCGIGVCDIGARVCDIGVCDIGITVDCGIGVNLVNGKVSSCSTVCTDLLVGAYVCGIGVCGIGVCGTNSYASGWSGVEVGTPEVDCNGLGCPSSCWPCAKLHRPAS